MSDQRTRESVTLPEDPVERARLAANRLGQDYRDEAAKLGKPVVPIIDAHVHINGPKAAKVMLDAMDCFGIERVYSQTQMPAHEPVSKTMGDRARFIAVPTYGSDDLGYAMRQGFYEQIPEWASRGARCVKFWSAPRLRDYAEGSGIDPAEIISVESPWRRKVMDKAAEHGFMFMVHIADPDTWFATNYADASRYGTKLEQYAPFERMLDVYTQPWMAAHMGGWPEDLGFLSGLLERHPNLILDTSATKWMVRELSKHPRDKFIEFLTRFSGRIVFGSDIVASDEHLEVTDPDSPRFGATLAASRADAFDLYASRYRALRTMFETDESGESNIADPDLALVEPEKYDALSAPLLVGKSVPPDLLKVLYRDAARQTLDSWYESGTSAVGKSR